MTFGFVAPTPVASLSSFRGDSLSHPASTQHATGKSLSNVFSLFIYAHYLSDLRITRKARLVFKAIENQKYENVPIHYVNQPRHQHANSETI